MSVFLTSSDGKLFTIEDTLNSTLIKNILEDLGGSDPTSPIPLLNVDSRILEKVIEYSKYHKDNPEDCVKDGKVSEWDKKFTDSLDEETLYALIMAADFLDIKKLLNTGCQVVADSIKGKTNEEVFKKETV
jgi:hypothetical protein